MPRARPFAAWLGRIASPLSPRRLAGLRWLFVDALFSQAAASFHDEFLPLFALALGATADRIGILIGVANLFGMAAYLPGAAVAGKLRTRKPFILATSGGIARLAILALAFVPLVARRPETALALVLVLRSVTVCMGSAATPAITTLLADLVPASARGRTFAGRNAAMGLVALAAGPIAGFVATALNARAGDGRSGYQVLFAAAFGLGALATLSFSRIPEPPVRRGPGRRGDLRRVPRLLARNPAFAWLAAGALVWSFSYSLANPFYSVYLIEGLGGTAANVGANAGIYAATALVGQFLFGALVDRRGNRRLFVITGLLVPLLPALWIFVRRPEQVLWINAVSGLLWSGYNLAAYNLLLETAPAEDREAGVAFHSTVVAAGAVFGPLFGGFLVRSLGYVAVFLLSGAGRLAATLLYAGGTRAQGTRPPWSKPGDPGYPHLP
jgi:MFS family permease